MKQNYYQNIFTIVFAGLCIFWVALLVTGHKSGDLNYLYSFLFGLIPFFGGIIGMVKSVMWGGLRSAMGRAIFFVSLGIFLWGMGENIWSYYNFIKNVPAPYPSLADIGFAPSIFFWIIGTFYLAKATGAWMNFNRSKTAKLIAVAVPVLLLIPSYYLQVNIARGGVLVPPGETLLKAILDIAYPFGDFLAATLAAVVLLLSYQFAGGIYRKAVYILLSGLFMMYVADMIFSYTTTKQTYYNADFGDLLLASGQFLITLGILAFAVKPNQLKRVRAD